MDDAIVARVSDYVFNCDNRQNTFVFLDMHDNSIDRFFFLSVIGLILAILLWKKNGKVNLDRRCRCNE